MYEGAPDYPDKDVWWAIVERYGVTILYTAPTAIRACIKWGAEHPAAHDLSSLRLLGQRRRADQPEGVALVPQGDRRRALPDRRHLVADGDRPHPDQPAARASPRRSRARRPGRCPGIDAAVVDEQGNEIADGRARACWSCGGRGRGCSAPSTRRTSASWRPTTAASASTTYLVGDAARKDADGYFWILGRVDDVINVSGPPAVDRGDRVGLRLPPQGRRVGGDRPDATRRPARRSAPSSPSRATSRAPTRSPPRSASTSPTRISKIARPQRIIWAGDLPKTRSGKIMRRLLRDIAEGRELGDVTTLRDPDGHGAARGQGPGAPGERGRRASA